MQLLLHPRDDPLSHLGSEFGKHALFLPVRSDAHAMVVDDTQYTGGVGWGGMPSLQSIS